MVPSQDPTEEVGEAQIDAKSQCGYANALFGILDRQAWKFSTGRIDEPSYAGELGLLEEAWTLMPIADSPILSQVEATVTAAKNGLRDNQSFVIARNDLTAACQNAGASIAIVALPEMGG